MTTETRINGQAVTLAASPQLDWSGWLDAVDEHVAERGWRVHKITSGGDALARELEPRLEDAAVVDIVAGPESVDAQQFLDSLLGTLPQFRAALRAHADLFSRGDWKSALESLSPLLGELTSVAEGLQLGLQAVGRDELPSVDQFTLLFEELSAHIHGQSWVEVSDLLLYELEPLLEAWDNIGS